MGDEWDFGIDDGGEIIVAHVQLGTPKHAAYIRSDSSGFWTAICRSCDASTIVSIDAPPLQAVALAMSMVGTNTALECEFRGANRAKSRHTHASQQCWCTMPCDGDAFLIDSWSWPGVFCRGHYPYWSRWGATDPSTVPLAVRGSDGYWHRVPSNWRLEDGLPWGGR